MRVSCFLAIHVASLITFISGQCKFPTHIPSPEKIDAYKKLKPLIGKRFFVKDVLGKFSYNVGICTKAEVAADDSGIGVIQRNLNDNSRKPITVGKITKATIMSGPNWILLEYHGGQQYGNHCGGSERKASIIFICDPYATDSNPGMLVLEENRNKTSDCYYLFQLDHQAICTKSTSSVLSLGSIFLIVFFTVVAVYLLAGALYQRFVLGAKGLEQIPNYSFWQDFGNLQADGCNLVCRSGGNRGERRYHGVGDDQLDDREERDDNLLPM